KPFHSDQVLITVANASQRRCLEIERNVYERRLELLVDAQAADLDEAKLQLKNAGQQMVSPFDSEGAKFRGLLNSAPDARIGVATSSTPSPGLWAPGCSWPGAGRMAASSRPRSLCLPSRPKKAFWYRPRSATSPSGAVRPKQRPAWPR